MKTEIHSLLHIVLVTSVLSLYINGVSSARKNPDLCNRVCGGISIPYPFGIVGKDCYLNPWYEVVCNSTTSVPFLSRFNREVVNISLPNDNEFYSYGAVHIKGPVTSSGCSTGAPQPLTPPPLNVAGQGSPFFLTDKNQLMAVGCNAKAVLTDIKLRIIGCESSCDKRNSSSKEVRNKICNAHRCCQTRIPEGQPQVIGVSLEIPEGNNTVEGGCRVAFLTSETVTEPEKIYGDGYAEVELGWYFDTTDSRALNHVGCTNVTENGGYSIDAICICSYGYFMFLFVAAGVLIGLALLFLVMGVLSLFRCLKKEERMLRRKKLFRRNGGLLLKQQLARKEGHVETSRILARKSWRKPQTVLTRTGFLGREVKVLCTKECWLMEELLL